MAVNSASSFSVDPNSYEAPSVEKLYNDYGSQHYSDWTYQDPDSVIGSIWNLFSGEGSRAYREHDRLQDQLDKKYAQDTLAKAREWEYFMSSTAYQRMVADLKAAGLNPWLAVQSGIGATSTNSATGQSAGHNKSSKGSSNSAKGFSSLLSLLFSVIGKIIAS